MTDLSKDIEWLQGMIKKRPETLLVLQALVLTGMSRGKVTAEDAHHIPVSHPNCRGAAMKYLARFGFVKDRPIKGTTKASKGHWLWEWRLDNRARAQSLINHVQRAVIKIEPSGQLELL